MRRRHGKRAGLGGMLLAALAALALLALPSVAAAKEHNRDRIPDRWEKRHNLSLKVNQAARDQDRDRLSNRGEFKAGDNPRDRDSDDDGVMDGDENAGTIASFDAASGRLVINLFGGDTVAGIVNGDTRIECDEDEDHHSEASASHEGEDNSGIGSDNSGPNDHVDEPEDHPGEHQEGEDHHGRDDDANCATAALVEGAVVEEAELELANGVATFEEVELAD